MSNKRLRLLGSICAVTLGGASLANAGTLTKVVEGKGGSPSPVPGASYERLDSPVVSDNALDSVVFFSTAKDPGPPRLTSKCFFRTPDDGTTGAGEVLACNRGGSPAPDGNAYRIFSEPDVNTGGDAAWGSALTGDTTGIFKTNAAGVSSTVAFIGATVSGVMGSLYFANDLTDPDSPPFPGAITDDGAVFFKGAINGGAVVASGTITIDQGIFCQGTGGSCGSGPVKKILLKNDDIPDRENPAQAGDFRQFCSFGSVLDASLDGIVFRANTKFNCGNGAESSRVGIFRKRFGLPVETIALENEAANPAPAPGGSLYDEFDTKLAIDNDGDVAFKAKTKALINNSFIFFCAAAATCQPSAPAIVAVAQASADDDNNILLELAGPGMSDDNGIVFRADLRKANRKGGNGIYVKHVDTDDLETVAVTDEDEVPPPGVDCKTKGNIPGTLVFTGFKVPSISPGGRVAFKGAFRCTAPKRNKREGIFLWQ